MSTELLRLPDLPVGIRTLTDEESSRLQSQFPGTPQSVRRCITCGGKRQFLWVARQAAGDQTGYVEAEWECPCEDQLLLHRYLLWRGVGTAYQRLGWSDTGGTDPGALAVVNEWLENAEASVRSGQGLLLIGNKGTGKTLLGVLLLKTLLAQGYDGHLTTFTGMIDMLMSSWRTPEEGRWFHARCRNAGVLVLDDVGREMKQRRMVKGEGMKDYDTATAEFALESVLRHRISMAKPTIITSNLTVEQLTAHYGEHFKSLLTESTQMYAFSGTDYRPTHAGLITFEKQHKLVRPVIAG